MRVTEGLDLERDGKMGVQLDGSMGVGVSRLYAARFGMAPVRRRQAARNRA